MKGISKGIKQYQADKRRERRVEKFVTPVVDVACLLTQAQGTVLGSMGTTKLRSATQGVSRMFESPSQRRDADNLEQIMLMMTLASAAGKATAKGYAKAQQFMAERSYAKAAKMAEEPITRPTVKPQPKKTASGTRTKRAYTRRVSFETTPVDVEV